MTDPRILPRYGADWIGGIVPAVLRRQHQEWMPAPMQDAMPTVLLVLDGLGMGIVERHLDALPTMASMTVATVTSVLPSTTAAGLTSIATGAVPASHGLLGYRTRIGGRMMNAVQWVSNESGPLPDPVVSQPVPPFLGRPVPLVNRADFGNSGFSRAHLRGGLFRGWATPEDLVDGMLAAAEEAAAGGHPLVYAYDDRVDKAAHAKGMDADEFTAALTVADDVIAAVLDRLPPTAALAVTADHGQLPVSPDALVTLDALLPLVAVMGGEARFRTLYAAPGAIRTLVARAREEFSDVAEVLTRQELIDTGWLGGRPSPAMSGRVGDVTLVARKGYGLLDPMNPNESTLRTMHGSMTPDEMLVPLIAARGRR